jgi:hypothetical protein
VVFIGPTTIDPETVRAIPGQTGADDRSGVSYRTDASEVRLTCSAVDGSDHGLTMLRA